MNIRKQLLTLYFAK